jgi:hypothetical protein
MVQIKSVKWYVVVLISCVNSQMNGHELIRWGGSTLAAAWAGSRWGTLAAHLRWVARRLRCSIHYGVSSYGFRTSRRTHFTNLGQWRRAIPSGWWWRSSLRLGRRLGSPPVNLRLQEWDEKLADIHLSLYAGSIAPSGGETRARWLPKVWRVPQLVSKNPSTIGRYL